MYPSYSHTATLASKPCDVMLSMMGGVALLPQSSGMADLGGGGFLTSKFCQPNLMFNYYYGIALHSDFMVLPLISVILV